MSFFDDRIAPITIGAVRAQITGAMQAAGLAVTNWRIVGVANQMLEGTIAAAYAFVNIVPSIIRGFASLDTSFDPGDEDPFDSTNVALEPSSGFLSAFGAGTFGTVREDATFANGFGTFRNAGPGSRVLSPEGLVLTWTGGSPPSPAPTYVNAPDATIYTPTVTVPAGGSIVLPIKAQQPGAFASAPTGTLSLTTSLVGCTFTNDVGPIVGTDREDAAAYKVKCKAAPARVSLGGPSAAYEYLATKNLDGTPLTNVTGAEVAITRVQVSQDSATGIVNAYFATGAGGAIPDDVDAANKNIQEQAFAVGDAITYTGQAASPLSIPVVGTARIKSKPGITEATVIAGILASLVKNGALIPIGGVDQVLGSGVVYTGDLEAYARSGYTGLYDVIISTPAGLSTAIPVGRVPVLVSASIDWTVTLVG